MPVTFPAHLTHLGHALHVQLHQLCLVHLQQGKADSEHNLQSLQSQSRSHEPLSSHLKALSSYQSSLTNELPVLPPGGSDPPCTLALPLSYQS